MTRTVADQFVDTLVSAGVRRIWGVVGDSLNGITDALRRHGRHPVAARRATRRRVPSLRRAKRGVRRSSRSAPAPAGRATCTSINGLFDAHRSRVPVVAIAAQIPSPEIGSGYFQETHPEALFKECSSYCELVSSAAQMPRVLEIALRRAVAERCVCVVVIPGDVALLPAEDRPQTPPAGVLLSAACRAPARRRFGFPGRLSERGQARHPALRRRLRGRARPSSSNSAARCRRPSFTRSAARTAVEPDNPYDVGMTGLIGFSSGYTR